MAAANAAVGAESAERAAVAVAWSAMDDRLAADTTRSGATAGRGRAGGGGALSSW